MQRTRVLRNLPRIVLNLFTREKNGSCSQVFNRELKKYHGVIVRDRENKRRTACATVGKEYFNCRSTREFRAHIRRSTDLSRTAEGLLAFSETKNKSASRGSRWFGKSGGCTGRLILV